jgi:hypothetical protein
MRVFRVASAGEEYPVDAVGRAVRRLLDVRLASAAACSKQSVALLQCPLYPRKQTFGSANGMSAKGQ